MDVCVCSTAHCHNRLVDPRIPVAALRAANPDSLKKPLELLGRTSNQSAHKLKAWTRTSQGFVLRMHTERHMDAHTPRKHAVAVRQMCVINVTKICVLFLASSWQMKMISFRENLWDVTRFPPLDLMLSVHLTPHLTDDKAGDDQLNEHMVAGHVDSHTGNMTGSFHHTTDWEWGSLLYVKLGCFSPWSYLFTLVYSKILMSCL